LLYRVGAPVTRGVGPGAGWSPLRRHVSGTPGCAPRSPDHPWSRPRVRSPSRARPREGRRADRGR